MAMYSKSSTFLALTSILAILAVLSIAINDSKQSAVRKPFATSGKDSTTVSLPNGWDSLTSQNQTDTSKDDQVIKDELKFTAEDQKNFQENNKGLDSTAVQLNFDNKGITTPIATTNGMQPITSNLNSIIPIATTTTSTNSTNTADLLVKDVNDQSLRLAGYTNFVIKPKPFEGKLFYSFDISMLGSLNVIEKDVIENRNGNDVQVLEVYEFSLGSKDTAQEIYDYLKAKIKDTLGITINESNQFGLSSLFINFSEVKDSAFLVVKTRDNVYALSYPKAKYGDKDYFVLTSALLKELI